MRHNLSAPQLILESRIDAEAILDGTELTGILLSPPVSERLEEHVLTLQLFDDHLSEGSHHKQTFCLDAPSDINVAIYGLVCLTQDEQNPARALVLQGLLAEIGMNGQLG